MSTLSTHLQYVYAFPKVTEILGHIEHAVTPIAGYIQYLALFYSWGGVGWDWVHLVPRPLAALLYQLRMTDECGAMMWDLAAEDEVIGGNLPQLRFVHHKSHNLTWYRPRAARLRSRQPTAWL
jgi:hypothetical protein